MAAQDARQFVAQLGTQAIEVARPSVPESVRAARYRQLFRSDFDLPDIARFVLGPHARRLSQQQQQEFLTLFLENLVQSYTKQLAKYAGDPFRVTGSRPMGDETVVSSQVMRPNGAPVEIDWHVADRGGRFLVTDVVVDGVSQKVSERSEFAAIVQRNGGRPDSLIAALRQQLAPSPAAMTGSSSH